MRRKTTAGMACAECKQTFKPDDSIYCCKLCMAFPDACTCGIGVVHAKCSGLTVDDRSSQQVDMVLNQCCSTKYVQVKRCCPSM
jgi:hypothetical protein